MGLLSKLKYFVLASLGIFFVASPVFASPPVTNIPHNSNPVATKANELKLRACQAKEQVIKTRMDNLTRLAGTIIDVFDKIDMRVEEFYQNKVVANGGSVPNYSVLVSDIQSKKSKVTSDLNKATVDSQAFNCNLGSPKDALTMFRQDMQTVKSDLKDYRTSIKNLIVAVKSVASTMEKNLSSTPKPTEAK